MKRAWEVLLYVSCIALGGVLLWLFYQFVVLQAPRAVDAPAKGDDVLLKLGPRTAVVIIVAMIALLAFVFWLFIEFGRRLSVRTYLGPLAKDAIANAEIARHVAILNEEWGSGRIESEPEPDSDEFKRRYQIPSDEAPREYNSPWGTRVGGLGGSTLPIPSGYVPPSDVSQAPSGHSDRTGTGIGGGTTNPYPSENEYYQVWRAQQAEDAVRAEMQNLTSEQLKKERDANIASPDDTPDKGQTKVLRLRAIRAEIRRRFREGYRQELVNAYREKQLKIIADDRKRAEELLPAIDISFLGGGWVFVLEFTTIIFIVFAVLVLGLLGVLNSEAIAAILAAIAGYVLGKSTGTRGAGSEETRSGGAEPKLPGEKKDGTTKAA